MTTLDRVLILVCGALVLLAVIFGLAAIFVPDFRTDGSGITMVILGALTTMASILTGSYFAKDLKRPMDKEKNNGG